MTTKQVVKVVSPIDGHIVCTKENADEYEIVQTVQQGSAVFPAWKTTSVAERKAICTRFVAEMKKRTVDISKELAQQMGRPIRYGKGEVNGLIERADYMISVAEEALQDHVLKEKKGFNRFIRNEPLGNVLVVAAWNYPFLIAVNAVIPAILAGNTVILKHSAQTPLCADRFLECFEAAGLPKHVFQILYLSHSSTARLIKDPQIAFVAFTGSVEGGHSVQRAASERFIGTGLELGGKDPAYVREDCDLDYTVEQLVDGSFFNSGQSCCGIERIYVHEKVYNQFVDKSVKIVNGYKLGDPMDPETTLGPLVKTSAADWVRKQVKDAIAKGAKALIDESKQFPLGKEGTPYMGPQILVNVTHDMSVMKEETFGPVMAIMKVSTDEEAIKLMNDSDFGLTASIWSKDTDKALALGERVETGTLFVNRCDYLDPALAWVGVKDSGRGCTLSKYGFDYVTRPKSFHVKLN